MSTRHSTTARSWRRRLFVICPPAVAVALALVLALSAQASNVYNITYPVSFTVFNPCNGEVVAVSGAEHDSFRLTFDGSGGVHVSNHANLQDVSGVGSFGNAYQFPAAENDEFNARVGYEETFTLTELVVSQGSAPNFDLHENAHITVNPDGTVTSYHDNFTATCQG